MVRKLLSAQILEAGCRHTSDAQLRVLFRNLSARVLHLKLQLRLTNLCRGSESVHDKLFVHRMQNWGLEKV